MNTTRKHAAHTLAGTMVLLVLLTLVWVGVYRQLASYLRIEKACQTRDEQSIGCRRAMAWALSLLETGKPHTRWSDSCTRRMIIDGQTYVAIWTETGELTYNVKVRPAKYWFDDFWPLAPKQF